MTDIVAKMSEPEVPHCSFDNGKTWVPDGVVIAEYFTDAVAEITRLRATVEELTKALELYEHARSRSTPSWVDVDRVVRAALARAKGGDRD